MATPPQSSPHASSNKRLKTLIPPSPASKGKSKVDEGASPPDRKGIEDESGDCCGICLSERGDGGVSRGYIDSCSHYFCFVCIMEWAKVESKCPLCKRRFSTIRRPPKPPVFASERVVRVPVRDQVYHYFGNATIGPPDPYSESKCTLCHGVADESLLLLCDLCDCAAHTYCVGLGATVPEGDWFCQDCTLLKDEQLRIETDTESGIQSSFGPIHETLSTDEHVSVCDIVQEPYGHAAQRYKSTFSDSHYLSGPSPSLTDKVDTTTNNIDRTRPRSQEIVLKHPVEPNARTLQHCRNLHDRIRTMRQNWNGFRCGIVHFSSSPNDGDISTKKSVTCTGGRQSCFNQQLTTQCSSSHTTADTRAQEIEKAWKMMDKAKSIKQRLEKSNTAHHNPKHTIRKLNAVKKAEYMPCTNLSQDTRHNVTKNIGSIGQPSSVCGKQEWRMHATEDANYCEPFRIGSSPIFEDPESSNSVQIPSSLCNNSLREGEKVHGEHSCERSTCLSSSALSDPVVSNTDVIWAIHPSSSYSRLKQPKEKKELKKIIGDHQKYCDAKSEIQSIVKLNLKLQTEEEKLEVNKFKEVARLATHSILAACCLEHPKPGFCSIPGFSCSHPDGTRLQKVSLMPNCCRECFYIFVKEMVNTVLLLKKTTPKKIS